MLQSNDSGPNEEPDELWKMASYLINRITHRYNHNVRAELKTMGLTTLKVRIIVSLHIYDELTVNELCIHAIAEQPTMSRVLDRLESDGLVSRSVAENDSRSRLVQLTDAGKSLFERIMPVMKDANGELLSCLKPGERTQLLDLLTRLLKHIRQNPI